MRILFLTQVLPYPLDAGPKVRAYHMLRHLSARHEVTLVSFVRPDEKPAALAHLATICHAVHTVPMRRSLLHNLQAACEGLVTGQPIMIARDRMPEMSALLRRLVRETRYDVIHADQLSMAGWGQLAARATGAEHRAPATLLDEHNAVYLLTERMAATEKRPLRRLITAREARAFARYEGKMLAEYDAILTVTEEDRARLAALDPTDAHRLTVVPICVDPATMPVIPRGPNGPPTILHLGTMFWPPNIHGVLWFVQKALPLIWAAAPETHFVIAGKNPPPEITALAADPRIHVTGYVADPADVLARSDAFIVPLHAGGGMRVKILDAWLWAQPVVSTSVGAEGMCIEDGSNILIADTAEGFAGAVLRLMQDRAYNELLRQNGRAWVEAHYSYQAVYQVVDDVYRALVRKAVNAAFAMESP